jgi:hypothetical protein
MVAREKSSYQNMIVGSMKHFAIVQDQAGRRYHYPVDFTHPISQLLVPLNTAFPADFILNYKGIDVTLSQTFQEIGYQRLSPLFISCPIDRISNDRAAQLDFLASESITDPIASEVLDVTHGNLREALLLGRIRATHPPSAADRIQPDEIQPPPEPARCEMETQTETLRPVPPRSDVTWPSDEHSIDDILMLDDEWLDAE